MRDEMLQELTRAMDRHDSETGSHSRRVAGLVQRTLGELNWCGPDTELIVRAAAVHDIGKLEVSGAVLNKSGPLAPAEWRDIERHVTLGAKWLAAYPHTDQIVTIVRHHHERWDGSGYPSGLAGEQIPFGARVIAVADSFDAMTSDRPYRAAMPARRAAAILRVGRWKQWDGSVVDAFLRVVQVRHTEQRESVLACA